MAEFYAARSWEIPPLPWTNLSPPFSPDGALDYLCRKPMSAIADLVHNRKLLATPS